MDEIKEIREALARYIESTDYVYGGKAYDALAILEAREAELAKDRDYWQALAMQFHDAVHAEIERRAKVEI